MPIQYVVMIYFSSSVNYVNVIQVVWFHGRKPNFSRDEPPGTVHYNEFQMTRSMKAALQRQIYYVLRIQDDLASISKRSEQFNILW